MKSSVERLYLFALLFAPLAFGTTEAWSRTILCLSIFLCATIYFFDCKQRDQPLLRVPGLFPLTIWAVLMALQVLPLPTVLVKIVSPATYTLYQETLGLTGAVGWMRLSVDLKATGMQLVFFTACVLFYVLTVQLLSRPAFLKRVVRFVIVLGAGMALLAIVQHFSSPGKIFWLRETFRGYPFGPYGHRNHYAGLMLLLCPVAVAMMLSNKPHVSYESWRERFSEFFNYRTTNVYLLLFLAVILMALSVFVSLSRGGIVCLSLALILLGIAMALKRRAGRGRGLIMAAIAGTLLLSVGWSGWEPIFARFDQIRDDQGDISEGRLDAWKDSMGIIRDFPLVGTGSGTFFHAHKAYRHATAGRKFFVHAHNDYIEIAAGSGLIGLACFAAFVTHVLASVGRYRKRRDGYVIYLYLGAITGLISFLIHCIVEFNLQIGANRLYFFFTAGLCIAAANTRIRGRQRRTFLHHYRRTRLTTTFAVVAPILLVAGTFLNLGDYLGQLHFNNVMDDLARADLTGDDYTDIRARTLKATIYDPLESRNYAILADSAAALADPAEAVANCRRAIRINPLNGIYLQTEATYCAQAGLTGSVESFHLSALKYEGANPQIHANYGMWLIEQNQFEDGARVLQEAVAMAPGLTQAIVARLAARSVTYDQLVTALPPRVEPFMDLGDYLMTVEQKDLALTAYASAVDNLGLEKTVEEAWIQRLQRFYIGQEMLDEAFRVVAAGVAALPRDAGLHYTFGTLYEKLGITYRAQEEYELAITLNPRSVAARRRLEKLQDQP